MVSWIPWATAWLPLCILLSLGGSSPALASQLPAVGEPALNYTDGRFVEPNGNTPSYGTGAMMNISWTTTYSACNLYLIHNQQWTKPVQIATNYQLSFLEWDIKTDVTNSSAIYNFRVVDSQGTVEEQQAGGFLSAAFYITGGPEPSSTPVSGDGATVPTSTEEPQSTPDASDGLDTGAKIGIGLGVGLGVAGILVLVGCFIWFRRNKSRIQNEGNDSNGKAELPATDSNGHLHIHDYKGGDTSNVAELHGYDRGSEMPAISAETELPADIPGAELPAELPPHLFMNYTKDNKRYTGSVDKER